MPSTKIRLRAYVTSEEYQIIIGKAQSARLSVSEFAKRACLSRRIKSTIEADAVLEIAKTNADLGRLGGLFKLWLSEPERADKNAVRKLLHDIEHTQTILREKVQSL